MFHTGLCKLLGIEYPIIQGALQEELREFRRKMLKRVRENVEEDTIGAGQVCGMLGELMSAKDVIMQVIEGASKIVSELESVKSS